MQKLEQKIVYGQGRRQSIMHTFATSLKWLLLLCFSKDAVAGTKLVLLESSEEDTLVPKTT